MCVRDLCNSCEDYPRCSVGGWENHLQYKLTAPSDTEDVLKSLGSGVQKVKELAPTITPGSRENVERMEEAVSGISRKVKGEQLLPTCFSKCYVRVRVWRYILGVMDLEVRDQMSAFADALLKSNSYFYYPKC